MDTERNLPFLRHYALEVRLLDLPEAGAGSGTGGLFKTIIIHFATLLKTRDLIYVPDSFCLAFEHKLLVPHIETIHRQTFTLLLVFGFEITPCSGR